MTRDADSERLTPYLAALIGLLFVATFMEGYDFFIVSLIVDLLAKDFHVTHAAALTGVSVVNIGAVFGFFVIRFGDRWGRKPVFLLSVIGCGSLSVLTVVSHSFSTYVALQFLAKVFLVTEFNVAILIVSEEIPARFRASAVGVLEMAGALGGGTATLVGKYVLPQWGWRGMYLIGGIPLVLVPVIFWVVRETKRFLEIRDAAENSGTSLWHIWTTSSRRNVALVGSLWFLCYLCYAGMIYHWVLFAKTERGWSESMVSLPMFAASVLGMLGYVVCGALMDLFGRRVIGAIFFLTAAGSLVWAFTARGPMMTPSLITAIFFVFALLPVCSTYNAELFPTDRRAAASAWCNFLMGRPAQSLAPLIVAGLIAPLGGIGPAVRILAAGPIAGALLILLCFPETKGVRLDDVS